LQTRIAYWLFGSTRWYGYHSIGAVVIPGLTSIAMAGATRRCRARGQ
jgi:hypothetical protein